MSPPAPPEEREDRIPEAASAHAAPAIVIVGPTAGGKTRLAIDLATRLPGGGVCVSADSMQIYRGMNIGTAKPTPEERAQAPHELLDIADPVEDQFTVDDWLKLAEATIARVWNEGRIAIVVGGTNLYIQALLEGLFEGPEPDPQLRAELQTMDDEALRARLDAIDPDSAQRIHPNDRRRTIRAIEVTEQTGVPMSVHQQQWHRRQARPNTFILGLDYPAQAINPRINARVKAMVEQGLIEEVRSLYQAGRLGRQAREALGYKQIIDALEGGMVMEEAIEQVKIRTRRFAKQQRTWLKRFRAHRPSRWLPAAELSPEIITEQSLSAIIPWLQACREASGFRPASPPGAPGPS